MNIFHYLLLTWHLHVFCPSPSLPNYHLILWFPILSQKSSIKCGHMYSVREYRNWGTIPSGPIQWEKRRRKISKYLQFKKKFYWILVDHPLSPLSLEMITLKQKKCCYKFKLWSTPPPVSQNHSWDKFGIEYTGSQLNLDFFPSQAPINHPLSFCWHIFFIYSLLANYNFGKIYRLWKEMLVRELVGGTKQLWYYFCLLIGFYRWDCIEGARGKDQRIYL